jgi:O-antigen/teichoic acid export membrane protein
LALGSVVFLFLGRLDVMMLGYLADSKDVGLYRSILPLQKSAGFIMTAFTFLFLPLATDFYEQSQLDDLNELYTVSTKWITALTLPIVLVIALFPAPVIGSFFGESYVPAAPALTILIIGMFSRALVGLNGDMVRAINRPEIELYTAIGGLVVNAVLNLLLIPEYGIVGAAVATISGYTVYNLGEVAAVYYYTKTHPFSWRLFRQLIPTTAVALACWALLGPLAIHWLFVLGGFLVIVQLASTILTRSVDEADILLIDQLEDAVGREFPQIRRMITTYGR